MNSSNINVKGKIQEDIYSKNRNNSNLKNDSLVLTETKKNRLRKNRLSEAGLLNK